MKEQKQTLEDFLTKRIEENIKLFTEKELELINDNNLLIRKIYILSLEFQILILKGNNLLYI